MPLCVTVEESHIDTTGSFIFDTSGAQLRQFVFNNVLYNKRTLIPRQTTLDDD